MASSTTQSQSSHVHFPDQASPIAISTSSSAQTENTRPSLNDGRKNSAGTVLSSPIESWKPDFKRTQSFQREELKRKVYGKEMGVGEQGGGGSAGEKGFTEGGEGTRRV